MQRIVFLVLLVCACTEIVRGEEYPGNDQYILFLDGRTKEIRIIERDSILYTGNFTRPVKLQKDTYPETLGAYNYAYTIGGKNYFVHSGAGVVLEQEGNRLRRIDKSFPHQNQFLASPFTYKEQMYLFAGYGLFTHKNITTRYDFKRGEWFNVFYLSEAAPPAGRYYKTFVLGKYLYAFSGVLPIHGGDDTERPKENALWRLDLESSQWKNLGIINLDDSHVERHRYLQSFVVGGVYYLIDDGTSVAIDIKNQKIHYYHTQALFLTPKVVYNPKDKTLNFLTISGQNRGPELYTIPLGQFLGKPYRSVDLLKEEKSSSLIALGGVGMLLLLGAGTYFLFSRRNEQKQTENTLALEKPLASPPVHTIVFDPSSGKILYKDRELIDFTPLELKVLRYLLYSYGVYQPINSLNDIVEKELQTTSINSILRKRESLIHLIKTKISILLDIKYEEVLLERRSQEDRRIKEIKLNKNYFTLLPENEQP